MRHANTHPRRALAATAAVLAVLILGSCATTAQQEDDEAPFGEVEVVVIAPFDYRSTVSAVANGSGGGSGSDGADGSDAEARTAPLDPRVAAAMQEELADALTETGRQVIVLSEEETRTLVPGEVDEMAARLGGDVVVRGAVRLSESSVDYVVSVSSTVGRAEPAPLSVSASAQERYPREKLDVETVTSGVGALVIGQVIGILEAP